MECSISKNLIPLQLGYSSAGEVVQTGKGVSGFHVGDMVVSNGNHAEYVCVPKNLAAKIPDNVSDEEAVFTVIGAIGLQGIRLLKPTFGETIVVFTAGIAVLAILKNNKKEVKKLKSKKKVLNNG